MLAVDYCHYFRAYFDAYHYPKYYHSLAAMVRNWRGIETDEDWNAFVDKVFFF